MTAFEPPRSAAERKRDTLARLESDEDLWVATADQDGNAALVPLSFLWNGAVLVLATPERSVTGRNLAASGRVRLGLGPTRDVVMIDGRVETFSQDTVPVEPADAFAARHHWDAREEATPYAYFLVTPERIQAWREVNELKDRDLMREGTWLA